MCIRDRGEQRVALRAAVRSDASVNPAVDFEVAGGGKASIALLAHKLLFTRVLLPVGTEGTRLREC